VSLLTACLGVKTYFYLREINVLFFQRDSNFVHPTGPVPVIVLVCVVTRLALLQRFTAFPLGAALDQNDVSASVGNLTAARWH
jgi:hypothetical protein